ncbi:hypothetical protein K1T71_004909 [Dendrolimus kikuchii]|uniref:Uncharacterized protein n=1 Tax=Dendrolimus kikuchii TaxID=765133 RepID=A0ACC1D735_9NEOP|nr:hypothetical protein K1T71_004909 [Dendrolimus kikuchii]
MQTLKLRTVINLPAIKQEFIRNVAVSTAAVKANEDVPAVKSWKDIPGPSSLPVIGQLLHFIPGGQFHNVNGVELTDLLNKTYGPIVRFDPIVGRPALIFLFDAESSSQIFRGENWLPIRPGFKSLEYYRKHHNKTKEQLELPTGLITDHGDLWKNFRSAVNPVMLQPKTIKLYTTAIDEVAQDMITRMKTLRNENGMLNAKFDDEMNLWALESIAIVALGCRLNCLDPNLPKDSPAMKLIQCVHDIFIAADKLDFKPSVWRFISTPTFKKAMKLYEDQENIAKYFVRQGVEQLKKNPTKSDEQKGVLEKLLEINEEYAYIMASDMLFAGVDTASNTMTATLYLLAKNPEKQEKLREEVLSKKDKKPYLRACIKESFRVMPIVSGNIRLTTKEYNLLGYHIPKDIHIAFGHQHMSLMETYYPRAKEFIPERWLAEKTDPLYHGNTHPFAYAPFGFGVRSCIGRRIAELEIETFLTRVIENFKVEWVGPPPRVHQTSLNYIKGPFNFIFKDV